MFFNKKPPYSDIVDKSLDSVGVFINLDSLVNEDWQILSVERECVDKADEHTVLFTVNKEGETKEFPFKLSREQHKILIESAKVFLEKQ